MIIKITEYEDGGDGCLPIIFGGLFVVICFVMSFVSWLGIPNIFTSDNPEDKKAIILYLVDLFTSLIIYSGYIYAYKNSMKRFNNCYGTEASIGLFVFATIVCFAILCVVFYGFGLNKILFPKDGFLSILFILVLPWAQNFILSFIYFFVIS